MKLQRILAALTLALTAAACTEEQGEVADLIQNADAIEFTAAWAEGKDDGSKTAVQSDGVNIWWTTGEEINVFFPSGAEGKFTSTNTEAQATATFRGTISGFVGGIEQDADASYTWAVYPYSDENSFDGSSVTLTLPSEQNATVGTFADKFFPAIARTQGLDLAFYNICGGVRFSVTQPGITSIVFKSNDNSPMAGKVKVGFGSNNKPEVKEILEPVDSVTVFAPDAGFEPGNYYFAAMIPHAHAEGIAETFRREGHIQNISISKSITVKRSVFGLLDNMDNGLVTGVTLNKTELEITERASWALLATVVPSTATDKSINWGSSDKEVAIVSSEGVVTGVSTGTAVITATTVDGGFTAECAVTVKELPPMTDLGKTFVPVDLGLPSGLKWASFNLGATKPEKYGDYFAWGETEPKSNYSWSTYKWCMNGSSSQLTKYCNNSSYGYNGFTDNKAVLEPEDDAAAVALGGSWRMATYAEWDELKTKCTWNWTTQNGVEGRLVTGPNGNSIFLPAAGYWSGTGLGDVGSSGYYWSSSLNTDYPNNAYGVGFDLYFVDWKNYGRCYGQSVRPVYGDFIHPESISLDKSELTLMEGCSANLSATISPSNATDKSIIWTSSNTSIATVDNGLVAAVSVGAAVISVTTVDGGLTAGCVVTVVPFAAKTPEAVDLGLPSGLKWASFNLGATAPEEYGVYFAWGETEPKSKYDWSTYKWCMGSEKTMTKYCNKSSYGYNGFTDNKTVLEPEDDAAAVALGGSWRMATYAEWDELLTKCTWTWTTQNGVNGRLITGPNGNSIFLPAAGGRDDTYLSGVGSYGVFWSSSLSTDYPLDACRVHFYSGRVNWYNNNRCYGFSVRPVYGDFIHPESISLDKSELTLVEGCLANLSATVSPFNASDKSIIWTSSNTSIASVSSTGVVTGFEAGTAVITATTDNGGLTAGCVVTVVPFAAKTPEAVDLGLPSGLKWASFNLGATTPEQYGGYFAWGETFPKDVYTWVNYKFRTSGDSYDNVKFSKYNTSSSYGPIDNKTVLHPEDDAAAVAWGSSWRMAADDEWQELKTKCTWTWTTQNGVNGYLVTGPNGNRIFLPAAGSSLVSAGSRGDYWSSSLDTAYPCYAYGVYFDSSYVNGRDDCRFVGHSVRPVFGERHVTRVWLDKTALSLYEGASAVLEATILPEAATNQNVNWSSSDASIATVDDNGLVVAVSVGTAAITVTTVDGGFTAECTVKVEPYKAQTPDLVDLGLPSGLKWASFNLGATAPEEYGDYFAWGETFPMEDYDWPTYIWCKGSYKTMTKYCYDSSYGYNGFTDNKTVLDPEDDAAAVALGGSWRMATYAEWDELKTTCTWKWTTQNGVKGRLVTGPNGNSIFLPAAGRRYSTRLDYAGSYGYYWSSSLNTDYPNNAYGVGFYSGNVKWSGGERSDGQSVRPVLK